MYLASKRLVYCWRCKVSGWCDTVKDNIAKKYPNQPFRFKGEQSVASAFTKFKFAYSSTILGSTLPPCSAGDCALSQFDLLPDSENGSVEKPGNNIN